MNFAVYSKDGCPYCSKVVQVLEFVPDYKNDRIIIKNKSKEINE